MSVLKRFRTTAKMEFFNTALKLRHDLTMLLLRDLGLKPKIRELELIVKDMPAADAGLSQNLSFTHSILAGAAIKPASTVIKP